MLRGGKKTAMHQFNWLLVKSTRAQEYKLRQKKRKQPLKAG